MSRILIIVSLFTLVASLTACRHGIQPVPQPEVESASMLYGRGLVQLHNFEYEDARDTFRIMQRRHPDEVMAYWGEAMSYNQAVWLEQDTKAARAVLVKLGQTREQRIAAARNEKEREYLAAVEALFFTGRDKPQRDIDYMNAM